MLVASTGVIGRPLPMAVLEAGIPAAASELGTDARAFEAAARHPDHRHADQDGHPPGRPARVTGFAKGAAMIGPNMATMLGFVLTDAAVRPDDLQRVLRDAVADTFNCISVEGHTSTNDTVLLLANGTGPPLAGDEPWTGSPRPSRRSVRDLAREIAADAEGAEHLITIDVEGCRTDAEARRIAKTVAESALVKTAVFGADPNWGRFVSAAGYSGVAFEETDLSLWMGPFSCTGPGRRCRSTRSRRRAYLKDNREVHLRLRFTLGTGRCTFYTCDLTPEYVRLNADYTT